MTSRNTAKTLRCYYGALIKYLLGGFATYVHCVVLGVGVSLLIGITKSWSHRGWGAKIVFYSLDQQIFL